MLVHNGQICYAILEPLNIANKILNESFSISEISQKGSEIALYNKGLTHFTSVNIAKQDWHYGEILRGEEQPYWTSNPGLGRCSAELM